MEKILLSNVLCRLQIQSTLKNIKDLEKELEEIEENNKNFYRINKVEDYKDIEETKDVDDYFESLNFFIKGIKDSIHSKRSKIHRFAHNFSYITLIEYALVFFIGLIFSLILSNIKEQPR